MVNKMKIEKEYDVQELANKVKESIKLGCKLAAKNANLDVITAQEIVDVLETVASWENKRTKLRDIREEILKHDCFGTYCDVIDCAMCECEEECKKETEHECFGSHINGNEKCNLCVYEKDCMIETEERGEKCFEKSDCKRPTIICGACKHAEQCEVLTKHE